MNALDTRAVNLAGKTEAAKIAAQRAAGPAPAAAPPVGSTIMRQPIPSGGPDAGRLAAGQTGTMPYNYAKAAGLTDIEAGKALDMTKNTGGVHDLTSQRREGMNKVQNMFPGEKYVENPRFGGLLTPDQGVGGGPRQSFVVQPPGAPGAPSSMTQLPPRQPIPSTPFAPKAASGLESVTNLFKGMIQPVSAAVKTVGKYVLPPLAGLSAGLDVADVAHEYNKPERDYTKMGLKAASGVGGALSMFPPSAPVGIPVSLGASGIQYIRENPDLLERLSKRAGDMQYSDPMGYGP
jgi:hypothetical protein